MLKWLAIQGTSSQVTWHTANKFPSQQKLERKPAVWLTLLFKGHARHRWSFGNSCDLFYKYVVNLSPHLHNINNHLCCLRSLESRVTKLWPKKKKKKIKYVHVSAVTLTDLSIPNWMTLQKKKDVSLPLQNDLPMLSYKNIFQRISLKCMVAITRSPHTCCWSLPFISVQVPYQIRKWPNKYAFSTTSWKNTIQ